MTLQLGQFYVGQKVVCTYAQNGAYASPAKSVVVGGVYTVEKIKANGEPYILGLYRSKSSFDEWVDDDQADDAVAGKVPELPYTHVGFRSSKGYMKHMLKGIPSSYHVKLILNDGTVHEKLYMGEGMDNYSMSWNFMSPTGHKVPISIQSIRALYIP
jgi:hypothetical protein